MKKNDAYEHLVKDYLDKCKNAGCDSCIAEHYCIQNNLRTDRYPQEDCPTKLKEYLRKV